MWQKSTTSNFVLYHSRNYTMLHSNALFHNHEQCSRCSECSLLQVCIPPKLMTSFHNFAAFCWWHFAISVNFSYCSLFCHLPLWVSSHLLILYVSFFLGVLLLQYFCPAFFRLCSVPCQKHWFLVCQTLLRQSSPLSVSQGRRWSPQWTFGIFYIHLLWHIMRER